MTAKKCMPKCDVMAENYVSSDVNQEIVLSVKPDDSHHGKESKSNWHSKGQDSAKYSDIKAGSQHAFKCSIRDSIPGNQTAVYETDDKGPTETAAHGRSDNDSWDVALAQHEERVRNMSVLDGWRRHSPTISAKPCWSTSHSLSHVSQYGSKSQDDNCRSRRGLTRYPSDFAGSQDVSKKSNWEKAGQLQTARTSSTNIQSNGWDSWVAACDQTDKWDTMSTKKCTPKCRLLDEKHASLASQEIIFVKSGDPHHEKEPNADCHSKFPKRAKCSDIKGGCQHVSKHSIQDSIHGNQTVVHKTYNEGHTDSFAAAHDQSDNDGWTAAHGQNDKDRLTTAHGQDDEQARNSSVLDEWQHHSPTISKKHDWSTSHRGCKRGPFHGSRFEYETWDERCQSSGGLVTHISESAGSKDGFKSSNWEKSIGLPSASRSVGSNKVTVGWDPWVAACDQTNQVDRMNPKKHNPRCVLMDEKHAPSVSQEILSSVKPDDSYHEKEPKSDRHLKFVETDSKENTDNWSAARDHHDAWLRNASCHGGWKHHASVSTKHGWRTSYRSRSHSPSHGSRYGSETWDDRRSRNKLATCASDFSGSKEHLESSNWEKAIGSQTVSRSFGPKKSSKAWDPWVAPCNQIIRGSKSMSSGPEPWEERSCNVSRKHGSSQSERRWNLSNTMGWATALDQDNKNMPSDLDVWRQGRSISPEVGWNRLKRNISHSRFTDMKPGAGGSATDYRTHEDGPCWKSDNVTRETSGNRLWHHSSYSSHHRNSSCSPFSDMKPGSESWNRRGRPRAGGSPTDYEDVAWRNSNNVTRETRGNRLWHHSSKTVSYSIEQRDHSRDRHWHWDVPHHHSDSKSQEYHRNNKPTSHSHGFAKERCHRGLTSYDRRNVLEDAPSHDPLSMREESGQRSHDRRNVDLTFKQRLEPQPVIGTPCKYFAEGQCCHGEKCKFSHQLEPGHPKDRQHDDVQARKEDTKSSSLHSGKRGDRTSSADSPKPAHWMDVDNDARFITPVSIDDDLLRKPEHAQSHTSEREHSVRDFQQSPAHDNGLNQHLVRSVVPKALHEYSSPWHPPNTNGCLSDAQSNQMLKNGDANAYSGPSVSQVVETSEEIACLTTRSTTSAMVTEQCSQLYTGSTWIAGTATPAVPPGFSHVDQGFTEWHQSTDNQKEPGTHTGAVDPYLQTDEQTKDVNGMRILKHELVEFVKDLLKPAWKNGHLSRETHKTIVKKVVDKVIGSIHGPDIPQTKEMADLYLLESKWNINNLVQGYIEKYMNS